MWPKQDWRQDLWTKRFVRDHLRYLDELQCVAARIVHAIRERARKLDPEGNQNGLYDSVHIRRGDFQYKSTRLEADILYKNSKEELKEGGTLYIATDERKKDFFKPFADHYDICFLDDFKHLLKGLNTNYYGMLDQLVASRGRIFFGTAFSTFTGYINRMRGYHSSKNKHEGYLNGTIQSYYFTPADLKKSMLIYNPIQTIQSYYFTPADLKKSMLIYNPIQNPTWSREFPIAWRDIDQGIDELEQ